jgi:group I intron endonuclease
MAYIYKITNAVTNKKYVGSTIGKVNRRWNIHKSQLRNKKHGNKYLQRSWDKYGEHNFIFEVIEQCLDDAVTVREQYYKDLLAAEYNLAPITEPFGKMNLGRKLTPEHKEKIRVGNLGKKMPAWFGDFIRKTRSGKNNPNFGKSPSEATRAKISAANKGIPKPPFTSEHCKKISLSHVGKKLGKDNPSFAGYYNLYHPSYGYIVISQSEWKRKYNNSKAGKIWQICNGTRKSYKGWTCEGKAA